ncbi:hypothetical protein ACIXUI_17235, partial [Bacteroides fragilis]
TPCSVKFSRKQISRLMIGYFSKNTFLISCQRDVYDATFTGAHRYLNYREIINRPNVKVLKAFLEKPYGGG